MANLQANTTISGPNFSGVQVGQLNVKVDVDDRRMIKEWLSPLTASEKQNAVLADRQSGTVQWFLELATFKKWQAGKLQTLWCHGIPGSGKTVLAATITDHLRTTQNAGDKAASVACVFCEYKSQGHQSSTNILANLWSQLYSFKEDLAPEVKELYAKHQRFGTRATLVEVYGILQTELTRHVRAYIVIDALDECKEGDGTRSELIGMLQNLLNTPASGKSPVQLVVTSRVKESVFFDAEIIEYRATDIDIRAFVDNRIAKGICRDVTLAGAVEDDLALRENIIKVVIRRADGMFLLARLYLDSLQSKTNLRAIRESLELLPSKIDDLYQDAWKRVNAQDPEYARLARKVLCWLTHSLRQITLLELRHALAIRLGDTSPDPEGLDAKDAILSSCHGIATVDAESQIIRLVHSTAQDFFERNRDIFFVHAHSNIAKFCLTYLMFDEFAKGPCEFISFRAWDVNYCLEPQAGQSIARKRFLPTRLERYPFVDYAAKFWGHHFQKATGQPCQELILKFSRLPTNINSAAQVLHNLKFSRYANGPDPADYPFLHILCFFRLENDLRNLLEKLTSTEINCRDKEGSTALHKAVLSGDSGVAHLLLQAGSSLDIPEDHNPLLYEAIWRGHDSIIQSILEFRAEAHQSSAIVHCAVLRSNKVVLKFHIDAAMSAVEKVSKITEILFDAAMYGQTDIVRFALDCGANIEAQDGDRRTALLIAVWKGRSKVVRMLLGTGASTLVQSQDGQSLLQVAVGSQEIFKERLDLVQHYNGGGDPIQPTEGSTQSFTAHLDHWIATEPIFAYLYDRQDVLDALEEDSAQVEIIQMLFSHDCCPTLTAHGETLLHLSILSAARTKCLLEMGLDSLDINAQDQDGRTALHYAAAAGFDASMKLLLSHGADLNLNAYNQATTLHFGVGFPTTTRRALEAGAKVHVFDSAARTPLHYAHMIEEWDPTVINLLTAAGAKPGAVDIQRRRADDYSRSYGKYGLEAVTSWIGRACLNYPLHPSGIKFTFREANAQREKDGLRIYERWYKCMDKSRKWDVVSDTDDEDYDLETRYWPVK